MMAMYIALLRQPLFNSILCCFFCQQLLCEGLLLYCWFSICCRWSQLLASTIRNDSKRGCEQKRLFEHKLRIECQLEVICYFIEVIKTHRMKEWRDFLALSRMTYDIVLNWAQKEASVPKLGQKIVRF